LRPFLSDPSSAPRSVASSARFESLEDIRDRTETAPCRLPQTPIRRRGCDRAGIERRSPSVIGLSLVTFLFLNSCRPLTGPPRTNGSSGKLVLFPMEGTKWKPSPNRSLPSSDRVPLEHRMGLLEMFGRVSFQALFPFRGSWLFLLWGVFPSRSVPAEPQRSGWCSFSENGFFSWGVSFFL